jgi:hypothetical protein
MRNFASKVVRLWKRVFGSPKYPNGGVASVYRARHSNAEST